jgi:hypothetical protein
MRDTFPELEAPLEDTKASKVDMMKVSTYKHLYKMEFKKHKQMASPKALRPLDGA